MSRPVWLRVLNRKGYSLFRKDHDAQNLDAMQERTLKELRETGISFARVTDLISEQEWENLRSYVLSRVEEPAIKKQMEQPQGTVFRGDEKYYNIDLFDHKTLALDHPVYRWALNEKILQIANAYMGMYTKFRGVRLWASLPVPLGASATASQRWHRDLDDRKLMKTFIYFDDVDETTGPFHYVRESHGKDARWSNVFPTPFPLGSYPPPGAVEKAIPASYVTKATGKAGTLIFCDTSGFHKGGYCTKRNRYMLFSLYASAATIDPLGYTYPARFELPSSLSPRAQFALENKT